jgi:pSer/pThr/pTyr-binding forkhead associated (FHA) protein
LRYCATCGTTLPKKEAPTHPEGVQPANSVARAAGSQAATAQLGNDPNKRILPGHLVNADQVAAQHCGSCGVELVAGAAFCQGCGSSVKKAATPAPTGARGAPPAKLVVIAQDGTPGREYPLTAGRVDIGREQGEVLLNGDPYACPRHARILWKNQLFWVMDLGSVNGVFARLTSPERLAHGDIVLIGLEVFRFEIVNTLEANREPAVERGTRLFGSPALPRYARLVQRTVEGIGSNVFYLSKSQVSIGRETGDFVFGDDAFMSRQHATFTRQQDGSFLLTDLGSSNGTFIAIRDERPLPDGGHVRIGQHLFRLKIEGQSVG